MDVVAGDAVVMEVVVPLVKLTHWCPLNQIQYKLHLWNEMAMCGKEMPQILVDVVYRISSHSHMTLPMLLIVIRFGFFITPALIDQVVTETNREATRWFREWNNANPEQVKAWRALGNTKMKAFIGLCCLLDCTYPTMSQLHHSGLKRESRPV